MLPLVTVIIPAYNYARFIPQALSSVVSQTYTHWECLVIDDGSTDNTSMLVEQFVSKDSRIHYVKQENAGPSAARNNGLKKSNGKYIQFLDADDLIAPDKLSRHVHFLDNHPEVDIVYGSMRYFRDSAQNELLYSMNQPDGPWMPEVSGTGEAVLLPLLFGNIMVSNSPLIRKSVIEDVGLFDETLEALEDWHYWLRCATYNKHFAFDASENTLALVRLHDGSTSQSGRRRIGASAVLDMWKKINMGDGDCESTRLYKKNVAQTEMLLVLETLRGASLVRSVLGIFKAGMRYRQYKWAVKHIAHACSGRL